MATFRPMTRNSTEVWLIGQPIERLNCSKLPSKQEVLGLFMNYKLNENLSVNDAAQSTAADVLSVWDRAGIPAQLKHNVARKTKALFQEWTKLKKNKNKKRRSGKSEQREQRWKEDLKKLFDITSAANNMAPETKVEKRKCETDKQVENREEKTEEEATSAETDTESEEHEGQESTSMPAKKTRKKVVNAKLSVCLDMAKLSDRNAALILTPAIQSLGHDPEEYACSYSTIARQRLEHRKKIAAQLKEEFKPEVPLTVH